MSRSKLVALGFAITVAVALLALYLLLPSYVQGRVVAAAKERGLDLTVTSIELSRHAITLHDVDVTAHAMPSMHATAKRVVITLVSLEPTDVTADGGKIELEGPVRTVVDQLGKLEDAAKKAGETAAAPATTQSPSLELSVEGSVEWKDPLGDATIVRCDDAKLHAGGDRTAAFDCDTSLRVMKGALVFGPYAFSAHTDPVKGSRLELAVPVGTTPYAGITRAKGIDNRLTVDATFPKGGTSALGIPDEALALVGLRDPPTFALTLHYEDTAPGAATGSFTFDWDKAPVMKGHPMPVHVSAKFSGDPSAGLDFVADQAKVGTYEGTLAGSLEPKNLRARATFDTVVMSCTAAAKMLATQKLGVSASDLSELAHELGVDTRALNVKGSVKLHADLDANLRDLAASKVTSNTTNDCSLGMPAGGVPTLLGGGAGGIPDIAGLLGGGGEGSPDLSSLLGGGGGKGLGDLQKQLGGATGGSTGPTPLGGSPAPSGMPDLGGLGDLFQ